MIVRILFIKSRRYKTNAIRIIYCVVVYYYLNIISRVLKDRLTAFFISFIQGFILTVGTYIFLLWVWNLFNCRKVFLCSVKMINSYLVHSYIHNWRVWPLVTMMIWKIWMTDRRTIAWTTNTTGNNATAILFSFVASQSLARRWCKENRKPESLSVTFNILPPSDLWNLTTRPVGSVLQ